MLREITFKIKKWYDNAVTEYREDKIEEVQDLQSCCEPSKYHKAMHTMRCTDARIKKEKKWYTEDWEEKAKKAKSEIQERKNIKEKVLDTLEHKEKK